ncbi:MAG: hypothetical protein JO326_00525, partial [Acetobacteraceae bacterium]|nr:hypothetical protein [Acetobacteraceae bacterium]
MALLLCGLSACALVDRSWFRAKGKPPAAQQLARAELPQLPLLTIRFDTADPEFQGAVAQAVEAVNAIKPDAQYDVVTPIPAQATEAQQDVAARNGQQDAASVVQAL